MVPHESAVRGRDDPTRPETNAEPSAAITLVCRACGRRAPYFRSNDPDLPANCETISQGKCDLCDDGDFSEEWLLDRDGNMIDPHASAARLDGTP